MEGIGQKKETDYIFDKNVMYVGRNLKQSR